MKNPASPLALVGCYFIQRTSPGFHGQIVAEAAGPWVTAEVCNWQTHKSVAVRVFNGEDLRAFDIYKTRAAWLAAVADVDAANAKKATP